MNEKRLARYLERRCREYMLVEVARYSGVYTLRETWTVGLPPSPHSGGWVRSIRTQRCYWQPPRPPGSPSAAQIFAVAGALSARYGGY